MKPEGFQLNATQLNALRYIKNTGGNATIANFCEDHDPFGDTLWSELCDKSLVVVEVDETIGLTEPAERLLSKI